MIAYCVDLIVERDINSEFKKWLKKHVLEMLKIDGFINAQILSEQSSVDAHKYVVIYSLASLEHLEAYFAKQAPIMRQEGIDRFGEKFSATRRVFNNFEMVVNDLV